MASYQLAYRVDSYRWSQMILSECAHSDDHSFSNGVKCARIDLVSDASQLARLAQRILSHGFSVAKLG